MVGPLFIEVALALLCGQIEEAPAKQPREPQNVPRPSVAQLLEFFCGEVADYTIYRDRDHREKLDFNRQPIYSWTDPTKNDFHQGALFVWTYQGCVEVVGGAFSRPVSGGHGVCHEFNSFSPVVLRPTRTVPGKGMWSPQAGATRYTITDTTAPADTAPRRLLQLRALAREFSAHTVARDRQRWELRVLAQPLYRYQSTNDLLIDGAVFGFVSSAGTDPEILMVIEAAKENGSEKWQCAFGRLSINSTFVERAGHEVWSSQLGGDNVWSNDPKHTFAVYEDKVIASFPDVKPSGLHDEGQPIP